MEEKKTYNIYVEDRLLCGPITNYPIFVGISCGIICGYTFGLSIYCKKLLDMGNYIALKYLCKPSYVPDLTKPHIIVPKKKPTSKIMTLLWTIAIPATASMILLGNKSIHKSHRSIIFLLASSGYSLLGALKTIYHY